MLEQFSKDWYKPSQKIEEFHLSTARIRALVGGRGSGKTTAIGVDTVKHSWRNAGAKTYILRKTQASNEDTTLDTFERLIFPKLGSAYVDTGVSLFKKMDGGRVFRLPSRIAVDKWANWLGAHPYASKVDKLQWLENEGSYYSSFMYFAGVPEERYRATRFRGYECSLLIFVEADQLARADLDLGIACLRWKGADPTMCDEKGFIKESGVILDTNPPGTKHWIAKHEEREADGKKVRYWHLRTEDNAHNLPENYVEDLKRQYKDNPAMYRRMLLGEYADAFDGPRVFYNFSQEHSKTDLPWPKGAYLVRGWDFGTTQAVVWSAYWVDTIPFEKDGEGKHLQVEYWWDLFEDFATHSDAERQCKRVLEMTQKIFPFWNNRDICAGVRDYCDIAGNQMKDTGSSVNVLRSYGIYPGWAKIGLQESIAVYNRLLEKRDPYGNFVYQIDELACPMLYAASMGGYRYPVEGEPGFGGNEPLKGIAGGDYDHIADASRYPKFNCLKLIKAEVEALNKPVGIWSAKVAPNPKKRWW